MATGFEEPQNKKPTPDACLIASLKAMLRAIGGTWIETWIAEAVEAAKRGEVVRYDK